MHPLNLLKVANFKLNIFFIIDSKVFVSRYGYVHNVINAPNKIYSNIFQLFSNLLENLYIMDNC